MSGAAQPRPFPLVPLIGVGGVLVGTIVLALAARITGFGRLPPPGPAVETRLVRFADQPDGAIAVFGGTHGELIATIAPRSNAFLRATMHSLGYGRRLEHLGPTTPFRLTLWKDGRLTLDDPATGWKIDLEAFGKTNEAAFARLLTVGRTS